MGIGIVYILSLFRYSYRGLFLAFDADFATASETPSIEFAPRYDLFGVPSKAIIASSIFF